MFKPPKFICFLNSENGGLFGMFVASYEDNCILCIKKRGNCLRMTTNSSYA